MNPLVTPADLSARLTDPRTVVLDATLPPVGVKPPVDTQARYLAEHIPGAVFFNIERHSDHSSALPHMLQAADEFSRDMSDLGVDDKSAIYVYEQAGVFSAPRAWWMLRTFGAKEVYILDGGLAGWKEAGLPVASGAVQRSPASFHAVLQREAVKDFADVQQQIAVRGQILDARSAGRFSGAVPEPRPGLSSGHMPGAISLPYTELVKDGRMKPVEELGPLFAAKGVDIEQPITTSCGSGVTAAVIALSLEIAGAPLVSLYDGSWAEYAQHPQAVIEKSS
jgi:thiosulfate/3-mercaptopyruvate sulfurtransferase